MRPEITDFLFFSNSAAILACDQKFVCFLPHVRIYEELTNPYKVTLEKL